MRSGNASVLLGILVLLYSFAGVKDKFSNFLGFINSYRGLCGLLIPLLAFWPASVYQLELENRLQHYVKVIF